jgi:hypothetical protein
VRAPRLLRVRRHRAANANTEGGEKTNDDGHDDDEGAIDVDSLPPADVPEWRLFALWQVRRW